MRVRDFDYTLPETQIALRPAEPRESARLLQVNGDHLTDRVIAVLPDLLSPGDLLVVNDTKVIPARLFGQRGMMRVEIMLGVRSANLMEMGKAFPRDIAAAEHRYKYTERLNS